MWGEVDRVLSSHKTGKTLLFHELRPIVNTLLFCITDYGYFTIRHHTSYLYLLDLQTSKYKAADVLNSPETESYH